MSNIVYSMGKIHLILLLLICCLVMIQTCLGIRRVEFGRAKRFWKKLKDKVVKKNTKGDKEQQCPGTKRKNKVLLLGSPRNHYRNLNAHDKILFLDQGQLMIDEFHTQKTRLY